ncbi:uncharacterized protein LOC6541260 [Drosophila erecta]|uniref:Uncharacterized protein, isoform A n=1 Tax=Drosophila erecta TaxID=7220 RepID=B3N9W7_DROER|nr:uncharacterized protein LOC6541260 [Drosophila erecta]XP_026834625.1 uncharacterized protein LOC6541260 [Drosophila erecta]XP_026834626.1 uncharacterized protein LOC6541260 [Drosophila erecta]XP_026834627.1 uncharacterized protein LOC6541260 [Drosophila erecta]EDV59663.1 uncharacterized protein Dere_GG10729, isoform A [Drosophila erecta]KQS70941.1 uncharacterized protein Dere_GG10729, isoform B [Drosophila erecta]
MNSKPTTKPAEIEQFLLDVRAHFRASLETSEYENTSNLFHVTAAEQTAALLARCEILLAAASSGSGLELGPGPGLGCADEQAAVNHRSSLVDCVDSKVGAETGPGGYLEMLASPSPSKSSLSASREYIDLGSSGSLDRCSVNQAIPGAKDKEPHQQLYEICQGQGTCQDEDEAHQAITFTHELFIDCPYADLPAGHLSLQRSTKYGQLQRIVPKRLFFDQTRKCYCGILNDWMLCYADGPTACRPSSTLYLKSSSIEIEHFGEGKRRDICFQITTDDPNKKFVYQANNEVDAKEWIHAIEAAIRGDAGAQSALKSPPPRKLPTPPVQKKSTYTAADIIYEEPSPVYGLMDSSSMVLPKLPDKNNSPSALARRFEYDVPKCPAQPLQDASAGVASVSGELESLGLLNEGDIRVQPQPSSLHGNISLDFQAMVKTVHSELSTQLSMAGPSQDRLKKASKKSYSNSTEPEMLSPLTSPAHTPTKDQKKQRKSTTSPQSSPVSKDCDKLARNWFLSRLNKSTGLKATNTGSASPNSAKCKQSEKENLLTEAELGEGYDASPGDRDHGLPGSPPTSPCLKADTKSKVNMIINQFESSGHLSTMFSVEALAANALASLTSFCESDGCNNYEPIMPLATTPSSFLKKV